MKGLLKNNFYASISNATLLAGAMLLLGSFVVMMDNDTPTLLIGYMLLGMVGFSISSLAGLQRENATKWKKQKLTAPVKRAEIIQSYFICQITWLLVGMSIAFLGMGLSILLHGFPFDRQTDILMIFSVGICISLFLGAFFFPLFHIGGSERNEATFIVSLLCAIGLTVGIVRFINFLFGPKMTTLQILMGAAILLACAMLLFTLSYFLTVAIFKQKEY